MAIYMFISCYIYITDSLVIYIYIYLNIYRSNMIPMAIQAIHTYIS